MNTDKPIINYTEISTRKAATITGFGLLVMTIFAVVAHEWIFSDLIVEGNFNITSNNIITKEFLFRVGIFCYILVIILDVIVAWGLFIFLKPVNKSISMLAAWFRLLYAGIFAIALTEYFNVLQLLSCTECVTVSTPTPLHMIVLLSLQAFEDTWGLGFIFFGIHIILVAYLVIRSSKIPKLLGVLLGIAGLGYLVYRSAEFLFPNTNLEFLTFMGWSELLFAFWLLWKGKKISFSKA